jgi:hypothetical protein
MSLIHVGKHTYGRPYLHGEGYGHNLRIGNFCSISGNVQVFLTGNHNTGYVTTFPFGTSSQNIFNLHYNIILLYKVYYLQYLLHSSSKRLFIWL